MNRKKSGAWASATTMALVLAGLGCEDTGDVETAADADDVSVYTKMKGETADCEFDVVTFAVSGGDPIEVHINGLPVEKMNGADKVSDDAWEMVTRRGVAFDVILDKAGIDATDDTPVNCVARDNFDPLRTKLSGDTSALPTLGFLKDFGYVYVGKPGDKDPLYPEMEGRSLIVDYDVEGDDDVPAYLGGAVASLGMFRWKMVEKLDSATRGIIEINPVVE